MLRSFLQFVNTVSVDLAGESFSLFSEEESMVAVFLWHFMIDCDKSFCQVQYYYDRSFIGWFLIKCRGGVVHFTETKLVIY